MTTNPWNSDAPEARRDSRDSVARWGRANVWISACSLALLVYLAAIMADVPDAIRERLAPLPVVHFERVLTVTGPRGTFEDKATLDWPAAKDEDAYKASLELAHRAWDHTIAAKTLRLRAEAGL